eukprot:395647-Hanusia_phi.AAC.1
MSTATASPAARDMLQEAFATPLAQRMKVLDEHARDGARSFCTQITGRNTERTNDAVISLRMETFGQGGREAFEGIEGRLLLWVPPVLMLCLHQETQRRSLFPSMLPRQQSMRLVAVAAHRLLVRRMVRTPSLDSDRAMQKVASAYKTFSSIVQRRSTPRMDG